MQMRYERCPNCMQALQENEDICRYCGFDIGNYEERITCLKPFTVLQNKYMIGRVIGVGGFGITYIGWDLNLQTYIAIKEYYPESLANRDTSGDNGTTLVVPNEAHKETYDKGLKRYVEEAQNLSKFYQLQGIVSVKDFFYENGTGYIVMEYLNGINLKEYLNNAGGKLDEATVLALMKPVLESLYEIHNAGLVHRDISPDNIMMTSEGKIKLIDFGSARGRSAETDKTYTVILKHGYAPSEQYYAKGNQGPWTDIYSLCATMYKMLTGQIPPNSVERMEQDEYVAPSAWGIQVSQRTEAVLAKGLAVKAGDRYQNIGELLNDLYGTQPIQAARNIVPTPGTAAFANPASVSQQSMHLSMQPVSAEAGDGSAGNALNKKKTFIIIGSIAAVLILAIVLIVLAGKGKDKDKTSTADATTTENIATTGDTTEQTTEEPATEAPDAPTGSAYVWPTELSDDWHDYQISINGTIYQFPMPYSEWASQGWKSDALPTNIAAGDFDYTGFYNDSLELDAVLVNYGLNEAPIADCYVVGVMIDTEWDEVSEDAVIELAGGIRLRESTEDDIKQTFGAPDSRYAGSDYVSLDYVGDTYEDGMDFELDSNDKLRSIGIINTQMPEGFVVDPSEIETAPPSINASYVAPAAPSTDRFDHIFTIDGVNYQLPVPVSEFTANGWILDSATDDYITGGSSIDTFLEKGGNKISVKLENYTANAIFPINAYITSISVDADYCNFDITMPGGIKMGDAGSVFESTYSDLGEDFSKDEYSSFISYHVYNFDISVSISAYADPDTGIINEYTYTHSVDSIK